MVAWYCALKLEMAVHLAKEVITRMLQSDIVPGRAEAKTILGKELLHKLDVDISVEDLPDLEY